VECENNFLCEKKNSKYRKFFLRKFSFGNDVTQTPVYLFLILQSLSRLVGV